MQPKYLNFDKVTASLLESIAEARQVSFADLLRTVLQDYLMLRPNKAEMVPSVFLAEAQQRTYEQSEHGPNIKFPCRKTAYFEDTEYRLLQYAAGKRKIPAFMRQIATWWLELPENREFVDQLVGDLEQLQTQ